jgi:hypothetical protein
MLLDVDESATGDLSAVESPSRTGVSAVGGRSRFNHKKMPGRQPGLIAGVSLSTRSNDGSHRIVGRCRTPEVARVVQSFVRNAVRDYADGPESSSSRGLG